MKCCIWQMTFSSNVTDITRTNEIIVSIVSPWNHISVLQLFYQSWSQLCTQACKTPGNGSQTHACSSFHQCCTTWARQQPGRNTSRINDWCREQIRDHLITLLFDFHNLNYPKSFLAAISVPSWVTKAASYIEQKPPQKWKLMVLNLATRKLFTDAPSVKEQPRSKALHWVPALRAHIQLFSLSCHSYQCLTPTDPNFTAPTTKHTCHWCLTSSWLLERCMPLSLAFWVFSYYMGNFSSILPLISKCSLEERMAIMPP